MLSKWVRLGREKGASDLHLEAGTSLVLRVQGELMTVGEPILADALAEVAREILGTSLWSDFLVRRSADLSRTIAGTRCRIHIFQTVRGIGFAIRLLSSFQNNIKDCNLHPDLRKLIEAKTGLVIISGSTGSGKSTTLAALIEEINLTQRRHIVTIESPMEYFFSNRKSIIRQREVQSHTPSFEQAIIDAMREDPDVLVIGEMRTPDVMRLTLNAAETGHLVLATMHSSTSAEALSRICMSFPSEIQGSIRAQLADCLIGVVCQRLTYLPKFQIQVPVSEVLLSTSAAKSNIRAGQFSQLVSVIQTGGEDGMWSFDRYQRWVDQRTSWTRPSQATPLEARGPEENTSTLLQSLPRTGLKRPPEEGTKKLVLPLAPTPGQGLPSNKSGKPPLRSGEISSSSENRIVISTVDDDLEELVKQIPGAKDSDD
jgi:twitching motility protein PilT